MRLHGILGGRLFYKTFKANNKRSVPSLDSVNRYIIKTKSRYLEGHLRCEELRNYLISLSLPWIVSLSEDATRIINRAQYDVSTNQIVGFVLPLNSNGMPIKMFYSADSASRIESFFYDLDSNKPKEPSKYVNVIMAQPLVHRIPAFCLLVFGTDGKYTAKVIKERWNYIVNQLKAVGIQVLTIATDSDAKYNSAMRQIIKPGLHRQLLDPFGFPAWFNAECINSIDRSHSCDFIPIQDPIHKVLKMRNRWLNKPLKFGKHKITPKLELLNDISHIKLKNFTFPSVGKHNTHSACYFSADYHKHRDPTEKISLPTRDEIIRQIESAKAEAIEYGETLNIKIDESYSFECELNCEFNDTESDETELSTNVVNCDEDSGKLQLFSDIELQDFSNEVDPNTINKADPFVQIETKKKVISCKKTSLCWFLSNPNSGSKLSNDRTQRVRQ